jgi:hypothetical protein
MSSKTPLPPPKYLQVNYEAMCDDEIPALLRVSASKSVDANVESYRQGLVLAARAEGASWSQIATHLGVTRQAAYARYGLGLPDDGS